MARRPGVGHGLVAVAACACAIIALSNWASPRQSGSLGDPWVLLSTAPPHDGAVSSAMQAAQGEEVKIGELQREVQTLDSIRNSMWQHLSHQNSAQLDGSERTRELSAVITDTRNLDAKLASAAKAEKSLMVQSEEIIDGGCKDNHAEMCGGESCCAFWAKSGQCSASSAHTEWMNVRCAHSCGSCTSGGASHAHAASAVPRTHALHRLQTKLRRDARSVGEKAGARVARKMAMLHSHGKKSAAGWRKTGLSWPPAGGTARVDVSMVLHGLGASHLSRVELQQALHRAVATLSPVGLSPQDVIVDSVQQVKGADARGKPVRSKRWAHLKRSHALAHVHATMPAPRDTEEYILDRQAERHSREADRDSLAPRRRLLAEQARPAESYVKLHDAAAGREALRVKFHVKVPAGLKGQRIVDALRAALREEVHRELMRHKPAHASSLQIALEHVRGVKPLRHTLLRGSSPLFGQVLRGHRVFKSGRDDDMSPHTPAEEGGLGSVHQDQQAASREDMLGSVLAGWRGHARVHEEGTQEEDVRGQSREHRQHAASPAAVQRPALHKPEAGVTGGGLGKVGLGMSHVARVVKAGSPLVGNPSKYIDAVSPDSALREGSDESSTAKGVAQGRLAPSFLTGPEQPAMKEIPWSFAQELKDGPTEDDSAGAGQAPAQAVGWSFEGAQQRPEEPEEPSGCGAECVKAKEEAVAAAAKLEREREAAEDLVAVKKEHVIEDARNLKHLMTAITEEKHLLVGEPAPAPPYVKPHWGAPGSPESKQVDEADAEGDADARDESSSISSQQASPSSLNSRGQGLQHGMHASRRHGDMHARSRHALKVRRQHVEHRAMADKAGGAARTEKLEMRDKTDGSAEFVGDGGMGGDKAGAKKGERFDGELAVMQNERSDVAADERLAAEERKELYAAMLKEEEAKSLAMQKKAQEFAAKMKEQERMHALAAEKLRADTQHYKALAEKLTAEAALAKDSAEHSVAAIAQDKVHVAEVDRYDLAHHGKVNVHARFNVDSPNGENLPPALYRYLQELKETGADNGAIKFGLHVNVDHTEGAGAEEAKHADNTGLGGKSGRVEQIRALRAHGRGRHGHTGYLGKLGRIEQSRAVRLHGQRWHGTGLVSKELEAAQREALEAEKQRMPDSRAILSRRALARQERKELYAAMLKEEEAKSLAMQKKAQEFAAKMKEQERMHALAAEKLRADTQHYKALAEKLTAEAALAKDSAERVRFSGVSGPSAPAARTSLGHAGLHTQDLREPGNLHAEERKAARQLAEAEREELLKSEREEELRSAESAEEYDTMHKQVRSEADELKKESNYFKSLMAAV